MRLRTLQALAAALLLLAAAGCGANSDASWEGPTIEQRIAAAAHLAPADELRCRADLEHRSYRCDVYRDGGRRFQAGAILADPQVSPGRVARTVAPRSYRCVAFSSLPLTFPEVYSIDLEPRALYFHDRLLAAGEDLVGVAGTSLSFDAADCPGKRTPRLPGVSTLPSIEQLLRATAVKSFARSKLHPEVPRCQREEDGSSYSCDLWLATSKRYDIAGMRAHVDANGDLSPFRATPPTHVFTCAPLSATFPLLPAVFQVRPASVRIYYRGKLVAREGDRVSTSARGARLGLGGCAQGPAPQG